MQLNTVTFFVMTASCTVAEIWRRDNPTNLWRRCTEACTEVCVMTNQQNLASREACVSNLPGAEVCTVTQAIDKLPVKG
jgi:hypothetical protein